MIKELGFAAYPVKDMAKAIDFYQNVLGLTPGGFTSETWQEFILGDGAAFAIVQAPDHAPDFFRRPGAAVAFEVDDFDSTLEIVKSKGAQVVFGPHDCPTCTMVVISDPDDNVVTLHKLKNS